MSTVEERKKNRIKKTIKTILENNPITGLSTRVASLLKGKLTPEKEITLESIISDLKLSSGDRGAAEAMPKKDFERNVLISKIRKGMSEGTIKVKPMKKGGKTKSKYSKGGGVRAAKYKI